MAKPVNKSPSLPLPIALTSYAAVGFWATSLIQRLTDELREHALRLNNVLISDGTESPTAPIMIKPYAKAALPDAATYGNGMIIVTDDVGGLTPAFSDGTNWRRTADRNIIS